MNKVGTKANPLYVMNCGWEKCEPGHAFGPAVRDHYLLHYVVNGKGKYVIGNQTYHLSKGDGFIIQPHALSYYQAEYNDPWEYYWIGFYGSHADRLMEDCGLRSASKPIFTYTSDDRVKNILRDTSSIFAYSQGAKQLELIGNLYLFLSCISNTQYKKRGSYIDTITEYIHYNYSYHITVNEIAAYVGLNRSYLCKIFKQAMGIAPQEYLLSYRLLKAKDLLKETNLSVSEIAFSCGFKDVSHFSYIFKEKEGVAPNFYRKNSV